jgi:SPP1 gp7 family putative phage head morphogenesis protein
MTYHSEAKGKLASVLDKLDRQEKKEMLLFASKWGVVEKNLNSLITELTEKEAITENQLYRLDLYKEFLTESKKQVNQFSQISAEIIAENQRVYAKAGLETTQDIIELVRVRFNRLPIKAVNNMIGVSSDGTPLYELLKKSYPETVAKLTDTLITSTALGRNPNVTARLMKEDMQGNLTRALRIARTEQISILRETSRMQMEQTGFISEWEWLAEPDACDFCSENNGKRFPITQLFETHPNCRCANLPVIE